MHVNGNNIDENTTWSIPLEAVTYVYNPEDFKGRNEKDKESRTHEHDHFCTHPNTTNRARLPRNALRTMWNPNLSSLTLFLLSACSSALPQAPAPTPSAVPWAEKVDALRAYILSQPTSLKNAGFWSGPEYKVRFPDNDCHQIRLYNWECTYDVPYKMAGIAAWIDSQGFRNYNRTAFETTNYYNYGYYRDPDDGWGFYDVARLTYGPCGNRGPQSACGHDYCTYKNGTRWFDGTFPEGMSPYQDPNDKNQVCPWLRDRETGTS
jgi:hypothetical protein